MLKHFFCLFMTFLFLIGQASASSQAGLKAAFDDLQYSLTVEWDQKDQKFKIDQINKFQHSISDLKDQGLTNAELLTFTQTQLKNEKLSKDLQLAFTLMSLNKMNSAEATKYLVDSVNKSYSAGANWSGDTWITIGFVALLITALVLVISEDPETTTTTDREYSCKDVYMCNRQCAPAWEGSFIDSCWNQCSYVCI